MGGCASTFPSPKVLHMKKIEIEFPIDIELTHEETRRLVYVLEDICHRNCPEGHAMWVFGMGAKPRFSQRDAAFLGKPVDPSAPESGEPTFDNSIFAIEVACRELSPEEIAERKAAGAAA